jgi:hypothetical protein
MTSLLKPLYPIQPDRRGNAMTPASGKGAARPSGADGASGSATVRRAMRDLRVYACETSGSVRPMKSLSSSPTRGRSCVSCGSTQTPGRNRFCRLFDTSTLRHASGSAHAPLRNPAQPHCLNHSLPLDALPIPAHPGDDRHCRPDCHGPWPRVPICKEIVVPNQYIAATLRSIGSVSDETVPLSSC